MWATLIGSSVALFQGVAEHFIGEKNKKDKDVEIAQIKSNESLELAKINANSLNTQQGIEQSKVDQAQLSREIQELKFKQQEYSDFTKASASGTANLQDTGNKYINAVNGVIALTRPLITLFLIILCGYLAFKGHDTEERKQVILSLTWGMDYALSYWFVRRSSEKFLQKKN